MMIAYTILNELVCLAKQIAAEALEWKLLAIFIIASLHTKHNR